MQASVARCLRTPPYAARRKGLIFGFSNSLRCESYRSTIVICNCTFWADTVAPSRNKANPFRRSSILFRPLNPSNERVFGGVAGYRPRVRSAYYERVYVHSPEGHPLYRCSKWFCKGVVLCTFRKVCTAVSYEPYAHKNGAAVRDAVF